MTPLISTIITFLNDTKKILFLQISYIVNQLSAEINFLSTDIQINMNKETSQTVKYNTVVQWV